MAVSLKYALFNTPREISEFAADAGNGVSTVVSIQFDGASGKWVIFYT